MRARIADYAKKRPTAISLTNLYKFNINADPEQRIRNAVFLHRELPIRLSQRIDELQSLPFGLTTQRGVLDVREAYTRGFEKLIELKKPTTLEDDEIFTNLLHTLLVDNENVVQNMADSVLTTKTTMGRHLTPGRSGLIDEYLNRFFMARIGQY